MLQRGPARILRSIDEAKAFIAERTQQINAVDFYGDWFKRRVGVVTGSFDALNAKHKDVIDDSLNHCDILIVAVTPDSAVKARKSTPEDPRPKFTAEKRAEHIQTYTKADAILLIGEGETDTRALWTQMLKDLKPTYAFIGKDRKSEDLYLPEGTERMYVGSDSGDLSTTAIVNASKPIDRKPLTIGHVPLISNVANIEMEIGTGNMSISLNKEDATLLEAMMNYIAEKMPCAKDKNKDNNMVIAKNSITLNCDDYSPLVLHACLIEFAEQQQGHGPASAIIRIKGTTSRSGPETWDKEEIKKKTKMPRKRPHGGKDDTGEASRAK